MTRTVTLQAALLLCCVMRALVSNALAGQSLERVTFDSASQRLLSGGSIAGAADNSRPRLQQFLDRHLK